VISAYLDVKNRTFEDVAGIPNEHLSRELNYSCSMVMGEERLK